MTTKCSVDWCGDDVYLVGYCGMHYKRHWRGKDMDVPRRVYRVAETPKGTSHCIDCDEFLSVDRFGKVSISPNGLSVRCKQCERYYRQEKKYGIDERDLLILQDGVCAICGVDDPCHPSGWFVDHDHKTGNARGMICSICNTSVAAVDFAGISWFDRARAYYDSPPASLVNVECKRKSTRLASWRGNVPDGMSYCVACQAFKPMSEFHKKKRSKYGIVSKCRYCIRLYTQVRSYGIDERMLLDVQDDACGICRTIDPNHSNGWQIDHDHKTGKARGVLMQFMQ